MNNKNYPLDQPQQKMNCLLKTSTRNTTSYPKPSTMTSNLLRTPAATFPTEASSHPQDT